MEISSDDDGSKIGRLVDWSDRVRCCNLSNSIAQPAESTNLPIFRFVQRSRRGRVLHSHVADDRNRAARRRVVRRPRRRRARTVSFSPRMRDFGELGRKLDSEIGSVPTGATALTPPGPAPPLMRSSRSSARAELAWRRPRASAACCRASARRCPRCTRQRPASSRTSSSEYVWRLCRLNRSVTGPRWGGSLMRMPSFGSRPVSTSQYWRLVLTPAPSGAGHVISAGATVGFRAAGAGLRVGGAASSARRASIGDTDVTARATSTTEPQTMTNASVITHRRTRPSARPTYGAPCAA